MGRLVGPVALAAAGLLAGVLFLEVLLQAGAWIVAATGRDLPVSWLTGNTRILCLGDSNTYGLWLDRHEAYPQQLEAIWNATPGAAPVEVLNLGFPGMNSSRLVRDFRRMLESFEPDVVIVMIGINDFWTSPVEIDSGKAGTRGISFLERHSRLWKLYGMVRRARDSTQLEVTSDPADAPESLAAAGTGSEAPARPHLSGKARFGSHEFLLGYVKARPGELERSGIHLEANLQALAYKARSYGTRLIIMTYPSRFKPGLPDHEPSHQADREGLGDGAGRP